MEQLSPFPVEYLCHALLFNQPALNLKCLDLLNANLSLYFYSISHGPLLHLLLCSRKLSTHFVNSELWPFIQQTLIQIKDRYSHQPVCQAFLGFVTADLMSHSHYVAAASLSLQEASISSLLGGWNVFSSAESHDFTEEQLTQLLQLFL